MPLGGGQLERGGGSREVGGGQEEGDHLAPTST